MKCYVCEGPCEKDVVHGAYVYWKCARCSTSQVLPQLSRVELQDYYDKFHLSEASGGVYDEIEDRMKADFPAKLDKVLSQARSRDLRMLDVGCGKGFFVKAAVDRGFRAEGIDISPPGVEHAVKNLGVKATLGSIEGKTSEEWRSAFDVVTLWATIEHLADPRSVLRAIHFALKPGGLLLCDTGLGNCFWENFLPGHNQWYDAPQHIFVFSKEGLASLLETAGFRVIHVDTNFERSLVRKWIRWARHVALCVLGGLLLTVLLGRRGLRKMKQESKWPVGRLQSVVARKV